MGRVTEYPAGTFCWVDLLTHDPAGSQAFYGGLFGWTFEDAVDIAGAGASVIARLDGHDICGIVQQSGRPSCWRSWISVDDLDGSIERARSLGGELIREPVDISDGGRSASLRDPIGASFGLWESEGRIGARMVNEVGSWSWNELVTKEPARATDFYGALFGWKSEQTAAPITRAILTLDRLLIGGLHAPNPGESDEPGWGVAFRVEEVDAGAAHAERLGGRIYVTPMDIPVGRFAVVGDPQGTAVTLSSFAASFRSVDGS